jgi:hypothetical protein
MPAGTGFDSLRFFNSGTAADDDAQPLEASNLGGHRSSTELDLLAAFGAMARLDIQRAGSANSAGVGSLEADGAGAFRWTAPGSAVAGPWVTIADGQAGILPDGQQASHALRVARSGTPGAGVESIKVLEIFNNSVGLSDITDAQRTAGRAEYRALFLQNAGAAAQDVAVYLGNLGTQRALHASGYGASGAVTVTVASGTFKDWPASGYVQNERTGEVLYYSARTTTALTVPAAGRDVWGELSGGAAGLSADALYPVPGLRIALEEPDAQPAGAVQTIANVTTAPAGLTWKHPSNSASADVLTRNALGAGEILALWLQRTVPAGSTARALVDQSVIVVHSES